MKNLEDNITRRVCLWLENDYNFYRWIHSEIKERLQRGKDREEVIGTVADIVREDFFMVWEERFCYEHGLFPSALTEVLRVSIEYVDFEEIVANEVDAQLENVDA